jgi:Mn2+/Fe2+ NRAMP family transporter
MKGFFWAIIAVYLLLYFYAVYLYEGFTLVSAFGVLACIGVVAWLLFRGWNKPEKGTAKPAKEKVEMRWYQSPFPYLLVAVLGAVIAFAMR